jgi:hypothetical protein
MMESIKRRNKMKKAGFLFMACAALGALIPLAVSENPWDWNDESYTDDNGGYDNGDQGRFDDDGDYDYDKDGWFNGDGDRFDDADEYDGENGLYDNDDYNGYGDGYTDLGYRPYAADYGYGGVDYYTDDWYEDDDSFSDWFEDWL